MMMIVFVLRALHAYYMIVRRWGVSSCPLITILEPSSRDGYYNWASEFFIFFFDEKLYQPSRVNNDSLSTLYQAREQKGRVISLPLTSFSIDSVIITFNSPFKKMDQCRRVLRRTGSSCWVINKVDLNIIKNRAGRKEEEEEREKSKNKEPRKKKR